MRAATLFMALLALSPCFGSGATVAGTTPAAKFYDSRFECYAGPLALHLPDTYAQLLRLGPIRHIEDVRRQSEHALTTTLRQIEFPGLTLVVYVFSGDPVHYQLARVQIRSAAWQLSILTVGQPVGAISLTNRWPPLPSLGSWEIQGDDSHLLVHLSAGKVAAVDYFCDSGS